MRFLFRGFSHVSPLLSRDFVALTCRHARRIMVSDSDLRDTLEKQARDAEETVSLLKSQLVLLQRAAEKKLKSSNPQDEVVALKKKNGELHQEVKRLMTELEYWEVRNGLVQIPLPKSTPSGKPVTAKLPTAATPVKQMEVQAPKAEKKEKKAAKEKKADKGGDKKTTNEAKAVDVSRLDFRVGKILSAKRHPDADTLFVEEIDVGEESPRTVCSGLVGSVTLEELQGRMAVIMCNLKPVKMRGIVSQAMVMCACADNKYEVLDPPPGSVPGDRVGFEKYPGTPDGQLNPKRKVWENVQPDLITDDNCVAIYKGDPFSVSGKGVCKAQTLSNAKVR